MRKKYLSALLFGALLVTSAGTFTSCKDYDDDIKNLQGQIDEIKTTLSELEEQIGTAGVSSVTFDEATGVLTVVDGNGTKTYKIQTSAEAKVEAEITADGKLIINGEEIGTVAGGDKVTVDAEGNLLVNDEVVGKLGNGTEVSMIKDEANKTVTIKVGDETVTLPMNADAAVAPVIEANGQTWNVAWGVAASDITFGDVTYKTGDLLLGGMTQFAEITVKPITYDLSAQTLKLVDIDGNNAPVTVVPETEKAEGTTGSRAVVSNNGTWKLSLVMDETVTAENIATAFTKKVNGVDQNLKYALTVNGTRVTGYDFVIDTQTKNESEVNESLTKDDFTNKYANDVETGEVTLSIADFAYIYSDEDKAVLSSAVATSMTLDDIYAEAAGVKVEGMKVTIPTSYTGKQITVKLSILDVTGAVSERNAYINVKAATSEEVSQVSQVEVAISADGTFVVPFGDIFSQLDASVVTSIHGAKITTADYNFFALDCNDRGDIYSEGNGIYTVADTYRDDDYTGAAVYNTNIEFFKNATANNSDGKQKVTLNGGAGIREIKSAKVTLRKLSDAYKTLATDKANLYGTFKLTMALLNGNNEVKKIEIPVKVVAPEFADYYKVNTFMGWDSEGNVSKVFTGNITLSDDYYLNANGTAVENTPTLNVTFNKFTPAAGGTDIEANATLTASNVIKTDENNVKSLGIKELKATATAIVATVDLAGSADNFNVEVKHEFKVKLSQQFDGAKLVYFNDGVKEDKASVFQNTSATDYIQAYYESTEVDTEAGTPAKYTGLAIEYNGKYIPVANTTGSVYKIDNYTIDQDATPVSTAYTLSYTPSTAVGSQGGTPSVGTSSIYFGGTLEVGQGGKLVLTFTDNTGLNDLKAEIEYVKTNVVIDAEAPVPGVKVD